MAVLGPVVIIEPLTGLRTQGLDMFPYPLGPVTDDAEAHLLFGNPAGLFDLLEGLAQLLLVLPLMPPEHMDDALAIKQRETQALRVTPLPPPRRALGTRAPLPITGRPGPGRSGRHLGTIDPQSQHRAAGAS